MFRKFSSFSTLYKIVQIQDRSLENNLNNENQGGKIQRVKEQNDKRLHLYSDQSNQQLFSLKWKSLKSLLMQISKKKLIYLGEIHSTPQIIALQFSIIKEMTRKSRSNEIHVVMEHFTFEMQGLLKKYQKSCIDFDTLLKEYQEIGTEGHDLGPYRDLLEYARQNSDTVKLVPGFLPRAYAKSFVKKKIDEENYDIVNKAIEKNWLPSNSLDILQNANTKFPFHFELFQSMISSRKPTSEPTDKIKTMFQAQLLKDLSMAFQINKLLCGFGKEEKKKKNLNRQIIVIAGNGHFLFFQGVVDFVQSWNPFISKDSVLIISHFASKDLLESNEIENRVSNLIEGYSFMMADYLFLCDI